MSVQNSTFPNTSATRTWTLGFLATLLIVVVFRGALVELVRRWSTQEEYSHGFLIPVVTVWLLWTRRDAIFASIDRPSWGGAICILLAMLVHVIGQLSAIFVLSQFAFVIALIGVTLAVGGLPLFKLTIVPITFLFFAIPLPYFIDAKLSLDLQLVSSRLGVAFIELFQIPVYLQGNLIDLGTYKLQVVDACSGLRYLFPLVSLSFLTAYLFHAPIWQRGLVLLSSIPITIAMNGFRIGIVGVTVDRWGPRMADGFLHFFEGWIIFAASALLLLIDIYLLARFSGKRLGESFGFVPQSISPALRTNLQSADLRPLHASLFLICAMLLTASLISSRSEAVPERSRFVTFPTKIGAWQGYPSLLEPDVEQSLALEDYILSDYSNSDGKVVNLYAAYYASQRTGESPHSPLVCIPGNGWAITAFERTNGVADHPVNRAIIERNGARQLVYYWYEERGRKVASEFWSKWYLLHDAITMNRSDGALVRLTTPILQNEQEQDADSRLRLFIRDLGTTLNPFLASANPPEATAAKQNVKSGSL